MYWLRNRKEVLTRDSLFFKLLKLVRIKVIFAESVGILFISFILRCTFNVYWITPIYCAIFIKILN